MQFNNSQLKYLDELVRSKLITVEDYFKRVELAYKANPTSFTEDEVDYIERQFKKVDLPFNRDLKAADANLISTVNQFISGISEGFLTLGWAEEPDTTVESMANKIGHLIGFAPDVIASFLSMGQYVPVAAAKRASLKGAATVSKGLRKAGEKAPGIFRKEIAPKTFTLQSLPMKAADKAVGFVKEQLGDSALGTSLFFNRGILGNPKFRNITEQGLHLGVAMGVSSWKEGPDGMLESAMHGIAAGALFGTIGNYVNLGKLYSNPATRKFAEQKIRDIATEMSKVQRTEEAINMLTRGAIGSITQGGLSTMQGLPVAEQIYEYTLGLFFGATTKSAGYGPRTKFILKNDVKNYELGMTQQEAIEVARKDPEYQALPKSDQAYIDRHIASVVREKYLKHAPILSNMQELAKLPEIKQALDDLGYDPKKLTQKEFQETFKQVKKNKIAKKLDKKESVELDVIEVDENGVPTFQRTPTETTSENGLPIYNRGKHENITNEILDHRLDISYDEMIRMSQDRDMNEPRVGIKNKDLEDLADQIRGIRLGQTNDQVNVEINNIIIENNYQLKESIQGIQKKFGLDSSFFSEININRLGSYLKLKKHYHIPDKNNPQDFRNVQPEYEIDLTGNNFELRPLPETNAKGELIGGAKPRNKYNQVFKGVDGAKVRLILRNVTQAKPNAVTYGKGTENEITITENERVKVLDSQFFQNKIKELTPALEKQGYYIYAGGKDKGYLILHRFPISEIKGKRNYIDIKQAFAELEAVTGVPFKKKDKVTLSNVYYELVESGKLNPNLALTTKDMVLAMQKYQEDPMYRDVQSFNKRQDMAQGSDIPLEAQDFPDTPMFNIVVVNDRQSKFLLSDGSPSKSGRDSVVYGLQSTYDTIQRSNFRPADGGFLKLTGFKTPDYMKGVGNILLKTGTFKASDKLNTLMSKETNGLGYDIHFVVSESAAKTLTGVKVHDIAYENNQWTIKNETIEPITIKPTDMYINMGVYESAKKIGDVPLMKQIFDKLNINQLGTLTERNNFINKTLELFNRGVEGDPVLTAEFENNYKNKSVPEGYDFNINKISMTSINEVMRTFDVDNPMLVKTVRKIMERGRDNYLEYLADQSDEISETIFGIEIYEVPAILNKLDYSPGVLLQPQVKKFVDKSLHSYRTSRNIKTIVEDAALLKLAPRDEEIDIEYASQLKDDTFLLHRNMRKAFKIDLGEKFGGRQTLESAWNKVQNLKKEYSQAEVLEMQDKLEFLVVRSPNSSNGGVRVLKFGGFVDRQGTGIITTSKNDFHLGGADKDADSAFIYSGIAKEIRDGFRKYDNEFVDIAGKAKETEKPRKIFQDLFGTLDNNVTPEQKLANLFDQDARLEVARAARIGKKQMGLVVDAATRMQNLFDVLQQRGNDMQFEYSRLRGTGRDRTSFDSNVYVKIKDNYLGLKNQTTADMARNLQADSDNIVKLHADSANFPKFPDSKLILDRMWNTYFEVVDPYNQVTPSEAAKLKAYKVAENNLTEFKLIKEVHENVYKVNQFNTNNKQWYLKLIEDFNHKFKEGELVFYRKLIDGLEQGIDMEINPYKYYFNETSKKNLGESFESEYDAAAFLVLKYREMLVENPEYAKFFRKYGLQEYWTSNIEAKTDIKRYREVNPDLLHPILMEYQGLVTAVAESQSFIANSRLGTDTAERIVNDVMNTVYKIKNFWTEEGNLRGAINPNIADTVEIKDVNKIIKRLKDQYKTKYFGSWSEIEWVIDTWLMTRETLNPFTSKAKAQRLDLEKINSRIKERIGNNINVADGTSINDISFLLKQKSKSYQKDKQTIDFAYKSIVIKDANRKKYFDKQYETLQKAMEKVTEQLVASEESVAILDKINNEPVTENIEFRYEDYADVARPDIPTVSDREGFTLYSGAAVGSDTAWASAASKAGHRIVEFKAGDAGPEVDTFLNRANQTLKRNFKGQPLLRRNYLQIKDSDMILAIGNLLPGNKIVDGGTGWAVQMGIDKGLPVDVFNLKDNSWYTWSKNYNVFQKRTLDYVPTLTPRYTGIGTRSITQKGIEAIQKVFDKSPVKEIKPAVESDVPPIEVIDESVPVDVPTVKTKPRKAPPTISQINLETQSVVEKLLPQFDWLSLKSKKNDLVLDETAKALNDLTLILKNNPGMIGRLEELFLDMTFQLEGVGRRFSTMNTQDLYMFNAALVERFSAKSILDKTTGKFLRKPNWLDNMLNYEVIGRKLEGFDEKTYKTISIPVIDKFGQLKPTLTNIILPTSTLEQNRIGIEKFDQLQRAIDSGLEAQHTGTYSMFGSSDKTVQKYQDLLIEHAWNIQEYQNGKYPSSDKDPEAQKRIKEAYLDTEAAINKITEKLSWPSNTKDGVPELISATEFAERTANVFNQDMRNMFLLVNSKVDNQINILNKAKVKTNLFKLPKEYRTGANQQERDWSKLEKTYLDQNGIIREDLVMLVFKNFLGEVAPQREDYNKLFSINDYYWLKYHMHNKDRLSLFFKKDVGNLKKFDKAVYDEAIKYMSKNQYINAFVGEVQRGYMPRLGHNDIAANRPLIEDFVKGKIEKEIKGLLAGDPIESSNMPLELKVAIQYGEISKQEAILYYKEFMLQKFQSDLDYSATDGSNAGSVSVVDLITRPANRGYVAEYSASMFQKRSNEFIPYYTKSLDAIKRYKNNFIKSHLTNLAGLYSELNIRRFDNINKGEEFAADWSNFIRDASINMLGLSTYRALNIHGIQEKDKALYQKYIDNGYKIEGLKLSNSEKDKVIDFKIATEASAAEKKIILAREGSIQKAKQQVADLVKKRSEKLLNNINSTGKYGSLYHLTSDENAVALTKKINNLFGGKLLKDLPGAEGSNERRQAILSRVRSISDWEGRFQLWTLLSHPKTGITNVYGGTLNTIADTGWKAFRQANSKDYVLTMLKGAKFSYRDPETGQLKKDQPFRSMQDVRIWLESLGVYDQMFLDMVALDKQFGKSNRVRFFQEFVRRVNKTVFEYQVKNQDVPEQMSKKMYDEIQKKTFTELAKDMKIDIPLTEIAALPMKYSERYLREKAFLANYINLKENILRDFQNQIEYDNPALIDYAMKGVKASQFMYQATYRPNFANTSLGRVLTRFQPYAWNSIGRRIRLFKGAEQAQWNSEVLASQKFQRQFTYDLFALAMANIFLASIFEYALSPPMNWLQDTASLLFGDEKEKERAFFSQYPHPVLAPLQAVTPPIGRFVLSPITNILNNDWETFKDYTLYTYFPFGRLVRDGVRTYNSPAMLVDFMTGLPLRKLHSLQRERIEETEAEELEVSEPNFEEFIK